MNMYCNLCCNVCLWWRKYILLCCSEHRFVEFGLSGFPVEKVAKPEVCAFNHPEDFSKSIETVCLDLNF